MLILRSLRFALFCSLFAALGTSSLYASLLSTAAVNLGGLCTGSLTKTGTSSASATLPCSSGGVSASANASFNAAESPLSTLSFTESAPPQDSATSTGSFDYVLNLSGGTGTGFLVLDINYNISGSKDAQASGNSTFSETLNGGTLNTGTLCQGPIAVAGPFSCNSTMPIGFGFTYGVPFKLALAITGTAGGGLGGASINGMADLTWAAITTGSSLPNPNARLNIVPEPSPTALYCLSLAVFGIAARLRASGSRRLI